MVSKLLDENTANIEKAKSLTAGLSAAQMNWRPQPGKWSIAQNLAHLNFGYQYFKTPSPVPSQPRVAEDHRQQPFPLRLAEQLGYEEPEASQTQVQGQQGFHAVA